MKFSNRHILAGLLVVLCSLAVQGCGGTDDGPKRASVSGRLTVKGKPLAGAEVHFVNPEHPQHGAYATTDAEGAFRLVQGAVIGQNKVFFSKIEGGSIALNPEAGIDAGQLEAMAMSAEGNPNAVDIPKQVIPKEYSDSSSKLTFSVPDSGTSEANFDL